MACGWRCSGSLPLAILLLGLILFHGILLPFLVGMAAAYLLDPAADWLQRLGFGRTARRSRSRVSFFVVLLVVVVLVVLPPLATQAAELGKRAAGYLEQLRAQRYAALAPGSWRRTELAELGRRTDGLIEHFSDRAMELRRHGALAGPAVGLASAQSGLADLRDAGRDLLSAARLGPHGGPAAHAWCRATSCRPSSAWRARSTRCWPA